MCTFTLRAIAQAICRKVRVRPTWSCQAATALTDPIAARASRRVRLGEEALGSVKSMRRRRDFPDKCPPLEAFASRRADAAVDHRQDGRDSPSAIGWTVVKLGR